MADAKLTYTIQKRRQKMHIKVYAILILIVVASVGFYSYQKWQEYNLARAAVNINQDLTTVLRNEVSDEKSFYDANKEDFEKLDKEVEEKLAYIFPSDDDYTDLTRQLDSFEVELSKRNSPFEISSIDYQTITENEYYKILPLRMNIRSSSENFTKFLHMIETSGSLDERTRLMDISSIRLNFESTEETARPEIINFTVQINAYFQK
ncbi:hypothetical protein GF366_02725 [Candidatus Peregrinibacteria bacterium]|nr:hypothetical protein [Candidatus Peregrinibacteria bacterium]